MLVMLPQIPSLYLDATSGCPAALSYFPARIPALVPASAAVTLSSVATQHASLSPPLGPRLLALTLLFQNRGIISPCVLSSGRILLQGGLGPALLCSLRKFWNLYCPDTSMLVIEFVGRLSQRQCTVPRNPLEITGLLPSLVYHAWLLSLRLCHTSRS